MSGKRRKNGVGEFVARVNERLLYDIFEQAVVEYPLSALTPETNLQIEHHFQNETEALLILIEQRKYNDILQWAFEGANRHLAMLALSSVYVASTFVGGGITAQRISKYEKRILEFVWVREVPFQIIEDMYTGFRSGNKLDATIRRWEEWKRKYKAQLFVQDEFGNPRSIDAQLLNKIEEFTCDKFLMREIRNHFKDNAELYDATIKKEQLKLMRQLPSDKIVPHWA